MITPAEASITVAPPARWVVLRCRPRAEKRAFAECQAHDYPCFLPTRRSLRRYPRKVVTFYPPLFPGYAFARLDVEGERVLRNHRAVAGLLAPDGPAEARLVDEWAALLVLERATLNGELLVRPEIVAGSTVIIGGGPLRGLRGVVTRRQRLVRVTVNVELIGQSVTIDLDVADLQPE